MLYNSHHLCSSVITPLHLSMKLLCARTRKSTRAVVHAPSSEVVGMMYTSDVLSVISGTKNFSSTGNRPNDINFLSIKTLYLYYTKDLMYTIILSIFLVFSVTSCYH